MLTQPDLRSQTSSTIVFTVRICWRRQVMRSALEEPPESLAIGEDGYSSVHSGTAYHDLRCGRQSRLPLMALQPSFGRADPKHSFRRDATAVPI